MLLERPHAAENFSAMLEEGHPPFDGFFDVRAGLVNHFAEVSHDYLREGRSFFNVCIYFWIVIIGGHLFFSRNLCKFLQGALGRIGFSLSAFELFGRDKIKTRQAEAYPT
jgi:hypothetical protein